jgi:hypothetical protein
MNLPPIPVPPAASIPLWYDAWSGLGTSDVLNLSLSSMALLVGIASLYLARQQVILGKIQADIAREGQRQVREQLAKKSRLELVLRGSRAVTVQLNDQIVDVTYYYTLAVRNSGDKTAHDVIWRFFLVDDDRIRWVDLPDNFDLYNKLKDRSGDVVIKGEGALTQPAFPQGGLVNVFEFGVNNDLGHGVVRPVLKWVLRSEDGKFPLEGDGVIDFDKVGFTEATKP